MLLFRNRHIIKEHFKEHGYKLYVYDYHIDGKLLSRKERLEIIKEIVNNNTQIKNKKLFMVILKTFKLNFMFERL